jgi:hemoglobin/transferrin/lactoferrin receptor protein
VDDVGKLFDSGAVPVGAILLPNPNLKPEKTINFELNLDKTIREKINLHATGYYTMIADVITVERSHLDAPDGLPYDDVLKTPYTNVNKGEAYIWGLSGQLGVRVTDNFDISSSLNYTYGRIKTDTVDTPLDHIPPVFGRTSLNLRMARFRGEFFAMYNGWKRMHDYRRGTEDNEAYATLFGMPAWYTLNVRLQYQLNKHFQVLISCENLLNVHYRVFASGISGAGRNLMLTIRARI